MPIPSSGQTPQDSEWQSLSEPAKWPVVVGVITIVFGSLGIFNGLLGLSMPFLAKLIKDMAPPGQTGSQVPEWQLWVGVGWSLIAGAVAVCLLRGGIALVNYRSVAAPRLKQWAWIKIVLVVLMVIYAAALQPAGLARQQQVGAIPDSDSLVLVIVVSFAVFGLLWGAALPVFIFWWFGRRDIAATVRSWGDDV